MKSNPMNKWIVAIVVVFAVLFAMLGALLAVVISSDQRALEAELANVRASGAPMSLGDLLETTKDAEQDTEGRKVVDFLFGLKIEQFTPVKAGTVEVLSPQLSVDVEALLKAWSPEVETAVVEVCAKHQGMLDQAMAVSLIPNVKPGTMFNAAKADKMANHKTPNMKAVYALAKLLSLEAVLACKQSRPDEALEYSAATLRLAKHVPVGQGLPSEMVAKNMRVKSLQTVRQLSSVADFSPEAAAKFGGVLDGAVPPDELLHVFEFERVFLLETFRTMQSSKLFRHDNVVFLNLMAQIIDAVRKPTFEADAEMLRIKTHFSRRSKISSWSSPFTSMMLPTYFKSKFYLTIAEAEMKLTRIGLALRQVKQASGAYPETLDALSPAYMAAVPLDPFTNKPFIYRKEGDGFMLYSLGEDGKDDGGNDTDRKDIVWQMTR